MLLYEPFRTTEQLFLFSCYSGFSWSRSYSSLVLSLICWKPYLFSYSSWRCPSMHSLAQLFTFSPFFFLKKGRDLENVNCDGTFVLQVHDW